MLFCGKGLENYRTSKDCNVAYFEVHYGILEKNENSSLSKLKQLTLKYTVCKEMWKNYILVTPPLQGVLSIWHDARQTLNTYWDLSKVCL